jgi:hypothetical protein
MSAGSHSDPRRLTAPERSLAGPPFDLHNHRTELRPLGSSSLQGRAPARLQRTV